MRFRILWRDLYRLLEIEYRVLRPVLFDQKNPEIEIGPGILLEQL